MRQKANIDFIILITIALSLPTWTQGLPTITVSGKVTDAGGNGIENARVAVVGQQYSTATNQNGEYDMLAGSAVLPSKGKRTSGAWLYMRGGLLYFTVTGHDQPVRIRLFTLDGQRVGDILDTRLNGGSYRINPFVQKMGANLYMLQIITGNATSMLKMPFINIHKSAKTAVYQLGTSHSTGAVGKSLQIQDTIEVSAAGFEPFRRSIDSYSGTQNFTLQAIGPVTGKLYYYYTITEKDYGEDGTYPSLQTAIWLEDTAGNYVTTLVVTNWTSLLAYGIYPDIVPSWKQKAPWKQMHTDAYEEVEAVTCATPRLVFWGADTFSTQLDRFNLKPATYKCLMETHNVDENIQYSKKLFLGGAPNQHAADLAYIPDAPDSGIIDALSDVVIRYSK